MRARWTGSGLLAPAMSVAGLFAACPSFSQIDSSAFYEISAKHSGKCLDVYGGPNALANGSRVVQWDCAGVVNQQWQVLPVGDGYHRLVARHSGKCLDVYGGTVSTANGAIVEQWECNGADNQAWKLVPAGDGYYQISVKHSGKSLDINGGPAATGNEAQAQQWDDVGAANQRWRLNQVAAIRRAAMTEFSPLTNGFQFANTFTNDLGGGARSDGLCGGMMYAAMDYFLAGRRPPGIDYRPAIGTVLQTYLLNRQTTQVASNLDRFEDMILGSGPGADKKGYFQRGIQEGQLRDLRASIDGGTPVVLALQNADDALGHSVLAIGYDMGRYRGDLGEHQEDLKIFVYDPNHPRLTRTLSPDPATQRYIYADTSTPDPHARWLTYFIDIRYRSTPAPTIPEADLGAADGLVHELRLRIQTGGDELVGGNDEVQFVLHIDGRQPLIFSNLNHRMRWISNYDQTISLPLNPPVRAAEIRSFDLSKSANPALLGVDAWDLDSVDIEAYEGGGIHFALFHDAGQPLRRFTENFTMYSAEIHPR